MRQAAGDLALDQHRVDGAADIVGDCVAFDRDSAGVGIDAYHGDVDAVRIDHVRGFERVLGLEAIGQCPRERGERHRRATTITHDLAVDDVEIGCAGLHELRRMGERLVAQLDRGKPRRLSAHDGDTRRKSAHAFADAVGLTVNDAHTCVVHTKRVGANLRHRRLHTLPERGDAGDHLDRAIICHLDAHGIEWAEAAFLHEDGNASANLFAALASLVQVALQILPTCGRQRLVEQAGIIARVVNNVGTQGVEAERVGHGAFSDEIAAAYFDFVDSDFGRDGVKQPLAHEA